MRIWKQLLSAILAGMVCASAVSGGLAAVSAETSGTYEIYDGILHYVIRDDGTAEITDFEQTTNYDWWISVEIPEEVEGAAVTSIAADVFSGHGGILSLILPETVTSIGENAFKDTYSFTVNYGGSQAQWSAMDVASGNDALLNATVEYTIDGINYYILNDGTASLSGYDSASGEVILPDTLEGLTVTEIYGSAFMENSEMTSVTIPGSVKMIGEMAFYKCEALEQAALSEGLISIEKSGFAGCTALESVVIPESVERLADGAFDGCSALTDITVPEDLTDFGRDSFPEVWLNTKRLENGMAIVNNIVADGTKCTGDVVIPDGITGITSKAFKSDLITSLTVPGSVQGIGEMVCYGNDALTKVVLEEGMTYIGEYMFYQCPALTDVTIPSTMKDIGEYAFGDCTALSEVTLPDGLLSLGSGVFIGCTELTVVEIPDSVQSVDSILFGKCTKLKKVVLPEGITEIPRRFFWECNHLVELNIPASVTSIVEEAFRDALSTRTTIYYGGSEIDWNNITIDSSSAYRLNQADIIYAEEAVCVPGDIDGSGTADLDDAVIVLAGYANAAAGIATAAETADMDVNGDSMVNLDDAVCILTFYAQTAAGLAPTWDSIIGA